MVCILVVLMSGQFDREVGACCLHKFATYDEIPNAETQVIRMGLPIKEEILKEQVCSK